MKTKTKEQPPTTTTGGGVTLPHTRGNFLPNILFKHIVFYLIIILRYCLSVKYNSKKIFVQKNIKTGAPGAFSSDFCIL